MTNTSYFEAEALKHLQIERDQLSSQLSRKGELKQAGINALWIIAATLGAYTVGLHPLTAAVISGVVKITKDVIDNAPKFERLNLLKSLKP